MSCLRKQSVPFEASELDAVSMRRLYEEVGESDESRREGLEALKTMLNEMTDIETCLEDNFLLKFLRLSKFDCSKAFEKITHQYQLQEIYLDVFKNCILSTSKIRNPHHVWASPYRLKDNSVLIIGLGGVDYSKISYVERLYLELLAINYIHNPLNQLAGISLLIDCAGFQYRALLAHTPRMVYLFLDIFQNVLPYRLKVVHVINVPSFCFAVYNMMYPFLSKKLKSRIFLHLKPDSEILHATFQPEVLPKKYGGYLKQSEMIDLLNNVEDMEKGFLEYFKYGYLKSKHHRESVLKALKMANGDPDQE